MSPDQASHHHAQQQPASNGLAQPGVARVGKYLMLDLLGEGAFGKVRIAVDETSGKQYAMKIMEKSHIKANELTLQVRREIAVMKAMRHPNIVNLHEVLTSSKNLYMVMDLVTGGELFDAVAAAGKLPEHRTRLYFQQLVDGVDYCHSRRVYHRDLKPENLLLSSDHHTLKITDFGLSSIKAHNPATELLHTIMGSPHYIAPEIITSAADGYEGSKVDVWAAGVILFGMLAGFLPFDEPNNRDLYKAIVHSQVKYPPHFSYDVIKLLRAMLQKDPANRPTMAQLRDFAWFKVNYDPAVLPEPRHAPASAGIGPRRKSKKAARHRADRSAKKKAKDAARPANAALDKPCEACMEPKPISDLFAEPPAAPDDAKREIGETPIRADSAKNESDQENVDPTSAKPVSRPDEHFAQPAAPKQRLATTPLTSPCRPGGSKPHPPTPRHGRADADDALAGPSALGPQGPHVMSAHRGTPAPAPAHNPVTAVSAPPPTVAVDAAPPTEALPPSVHAGCDLTPRAQVKDACDLSALTSPLSPEASRLSSVHSGSVCSAADERRHESLRYAEAQGPTRFSASAFVSPVSLKSSVSFSSPAGGSSSGKPLLSPNYRSLVPQLFESEENGQEREGNKEMAPLALDDPESSVQGARKDKRADCPPDGHQAACESVEECIFKPMKSLFAPLAEQAMERQESPSMSASVFCPEFDCAADGGPQWCLDNMEVFADVEGDDDAAQFPTAQHGTTSRILQDLVRHKEDGAESEATDEKPKAKSIFAPLDDSLAFKLTPSAENEATTAKALKSLPQAKPSL